MRLKQSITARHEIRGALHVFQAGFQFIMSHRASLWSCDLLRNRASCSSRMEIEGLDKQSTRIKAWPSHRTWSTMNDDTSALPPSALSQLNFGLESRL